MSVQEAIDFDLWFNELKLAFCELHKVDADSKYDIKLIKKDYYDKQLSVTESVTEFFNEFKNKIT